MGHDISRTCSILFDPEEAAIKNANAPVKKDTAEGDTTSAASTTAPTGTSSSDETAALKRALAEKDAELQRMRQELERTQSVASQAQKEKAEVAQQVLKHSRTASNLEEQVVHLERVARERHQSLAQSEQQAAELRARLAESLEWIDELQVEVEAKKQLEKELEKLRQELAEEKARKLSGLPPPAKSPKRNRFGVPLKQCEFVMPRKYGKPVPDVLVELENMMERTNAFDVVGIFRGQANQNDFRKAKTQLDVGDFNGSNDPHLLANLLTTYLREMPEPLLGSLSLEQLGDVKDQGTASRLLYSIPNPELDVLRWLFQLCARVAKRASVNKMTAKNIAICLTPNLISNPEVHLDMTPEQSIMVMQRFKNAANFTQLCIAQEMDSM